MRAPSGDPPSPASLRRPFPTSRPYVAVALAFVLAGLDETIDAGATWKDVSANLPDVPASSVKELSNGGLVLATDLATFYRAPGATDWQRLGTGLPLTVGMDVEYNAVYVATHGRGIWAFDLSQL